MFEHEAVKAGRPNEGAEILKHPIGILFALAVLLMIPLRADQPGPPKRPSTPVERSHRRIPVAKSQAPAPQVSAVPPEQAAPKQPEWPANAQPTNAVVEWNSKGLHIEASNSSLQQILKDVATATGATVSGLGADQRVFGNYGPGPATEVISHLLDGSGYNVLMIGEQGQGTPRQIVLSKQPTGPAPPSGNSTGQGNEDYGANAEVEEQPQPPPPQQPQPQPQMPPSNPNPNGFGPGAGSPQPRTPQQILQEMQQRQQQIEQMQQQQRNNPQ